MAVSPVSAPALPAAAKPRVLGVIPARLASTRLPRKMLLEIAGEPMLALVYRAARACAVLDDVLIATDSSEIMRLAEQLGFPAVFTPEDCASGTDRVRAVAASIAAEIYVNIQGDEPLLRPEHLHCLLAPMLGIAGERVEVATLATPCAAAELHLPSVVKVVRAVDGRALYFSRAAIPFDRDGQGAGARPLKHLGFYAYRKQALEQFAALPVSPLETTEKLEQLRMLENGLAIYVAETPYDTHGVDTEEDRLAVEQVLLARRAGGTGGECGMP